MKIGSLQLQNNIFLAPMAGISDLPYRRLMKRFGAGLVFSEMVSANGLIRDGRATRELLRSHPEERPLAIQLFGDDPQVLSRAAAMVEEEADLIDLNFGCPVPKVVRSGAGSAVLRDPVRAAAIVAAVRRVTRRPLTVKIRSGWDAQSLNFLEIGKVAAAEGADAVTLHPRTRAQGFSGEADWQHIAQLKEALAVPVIGSGDLFSAAAAAAMLETTRCDAVMIGRGGYGNPWLIRDLLARQQGGTAPPPSPLERLAVAQEHLQLFLESFAPHKALLDLRKHFCWYARGIPGAALFRSRLNATATLEELMDLLVDFFSTAPQKAVQCP
jgi:tRNA-dihydrouridine synthase B